MLQPVNRYILIEMPLAHDPQESLIVLPEDYKPEEDRFVQVNALKAAPDVRFPIKSDTKLVVDRSMIEEISLGGTIYNVILDNYVVGMME